MLRGTLSHKSRQVYEALLTSYGGSLDEVSVYGQALSAGTVNDHYRIGAGS